MASAFSIQTCMVSDQLRDHLLLRCLICLNMLYGFAFAGLTHRGVAIAVLPFRCGAGRVRSFAVGMGLRVACQVVDFVIDDGGIQRRCIMSAHRRVERESTRPYPGQARHQTLRTPPSTVRRLLRQHLVTQARELHGAGEACDIGRGGIGIAVVVACDGRRGCEGGTCSTCVFGTRVVIVGVWDVNNVSVDKAVSIAMVGRLDPHRGQRSTTRSAVPCCTSRSGGRDGSRQGECRCQDTGAAVPCRARQHAPNLATRSLFAQRKRIASEVC